MVYIAYYTELKLQLHAKRRICRANSKYAPDEFFCGHFCSRWKAAHPALLLLWIHRQIVRLFCRDTKIKVVWILQKCIICLVSMPRMYAFSCDSSNNETACLSNRISRKQRVSHQCGRACDTSDCLKLHKNNHISCKQRVSHQCGKACDISVRLAACKRSCTDCRQRVSLQNDAACASWYH